MKIKKSWKETNWDMWTFGKKVRHVLVVIASIIAWFIMIAFFVVIFGYILLILLGMHGILLDIRDQFIFEIVRHFL